MCITPGVQYDSIILKAGFVNFVYQFPFNIGLIIGQGNFRVLSGQLINVTLEVLITINGLFPNAQEI